MARVFALLAALLLLPVCAQAADKTPDILPKFERAAIRNVISAQLRAFRNDDAERAFSYATPSMQNYMGSAAAFLDIVKASYPSVYRLRDMQFRELEVIDGELVQKTFFIGPQGEAILGLYYMVKQPDGQWKINGCTLTDAPDRSI